ncbi:MAG: 16S rRNA (guanine(527)-N(7))-methyltransferase RsmG [Clostridia bacterium]|nr:16S rRNA (guanine(527)-N(7))-methyltransferase RsmG [Clostridia bacterium]
MNAANVVNADYEILQKALADFGLTFTADDVQRLYKFLHRLLQANRTVNLTALTSWEDVVSKHLLDSLALLKAPWWQEMQDHAWDPMLDVGSGAGFPGLLFALLFPERSIFLLEANKKKTRFLQAIKEEEHLSQLSILPDRAETLGQQAPYREQFSLVTARAVARLPELLELTLPFCRCGGFFLAYKGPQAQEELAEAAKACEVLGGKLHTTYAYTLPWEKGERTLLFFAKVSPSPSQYPRRPGIPGKRPLL